MNFRLITVIVILYSIVGFGCSSKNVNKNNIDDKKIMNQGVDNKQKILDSANINDDTINIVKTSTKLIQLEGEVDDYFENQEFSISSYLEPIDSTIFLEAKLKSDNRLDTSNIIKLQNEILKIPTTNGNISYWNKPFSKYKYEGEEYSYVGYYRQSNAHVVGFRSAHGFGYDLIFYQEGEKNSLDGFPYLSNSDLVATCRIEAENIVCGFLKIYNLKTKEYLWAGWSDYTLLPKEVVWESNTTFLLKAEQYTTENDYYEQKVSGYKFGRITIRR